MADTAVAPPSVDTSTSIAPSAPVSSPSPSSSSGPSLPSFDLSSGDLNRALDRDLGDLSSPGPMTEPTPAESAPTAGAVAAPAADGAVAKPPAEPAAPAAAEETKPFVPTTPEAQAEVAELPEGIRIETRRDGSKQYVTNESAYHTLHNAYRTLRESEELIGEPVSREIIEEMNEARVDLHGLESSLLSPNAQDAWGVLRYLDEKGRSASEAGEIAHDPLAVLAANLPHYLEKRAESNPAFSQAYQVAANTFIQKTINNAYAMCRDGAARAQAAIAANQRPSEQDRKDLNRYNAARHLDEWIFQDYEGSATKPVGRPVNPARAELDRIEQARQQLRDEQTTRAQQQWNAAIAESNQKVESGVGKVISETLKSVEKTYLESKQEKALEGIRVLMVAKFNKSIEQDTNFQSIRQNLLKQARMATGQRQQDLFKEIERRYESKARILFDPFRNKEIRDILNQGARSAVKPSQEALQRAQRAAEQQVPSGGGTPDRPAVPAPSKATLASVGLRSADDISKAILADLG